MGFADKQRFAGRAVSGSGSPSSSSSSSSSSSVTSGSSSMNSSASGNADYITYTVKSGDSLWEIAKKYPGTSESDIAGLNNITNAEKISPGQVIRIKRKG